MNFEIIESVLLYLYDNQDWYHYYDGIVDNAVEGRQLAPIETQVVLQKLLKDGYIVEEPQEEEKSRGGKILEVKKLLGYHISYDGIFIIETLPKKYHRKPYQYLQEIEQKKKKRDLIERIPSTFWWIVEPAKIILPLLLGYFIGLAGQTNKGEQKKLSEKQSIGTTSYAKPK